MSSGWAQRSFPVERRVALRNQAAGAMLAVFGALVVLSFAVLVPLAQGAGWVGSGVCSAMGLGGLAVTWKLLSATRGGLVATLDSGGVTLRSGRRLPWSSLQRVEVRMRRAVTGRRPYRFDLVFAEGRAMVGFLATDFDALLAVVRQAPVEQREVEG